MILNRVSLPVQSTHKYKCAYYTNAYYNVSQETFFESRNDPQDIFYSFFSDGVVVKMRFILTLMTAKYVVSCEKRGYIVLIIGYAKYCAFLHFIFAIIFRFIYMIILHLLSHRDIFLMHL